MSPCISLNIRRIPNLGRTALTDGHSPASELQAGHRTARAQAYDVIIADCGRAHVRGITNRVSRVSRAPACLPSPKNMAGDHGAHAGHELPYCFKGRGKSDCVHPQLCGDSGMARFRLTRDAFLQNRSRSSYCASSAGRPTPLLGLPPCFPRFRSRRVTTKGPVGNSPRPEAERFLKLR